MSFSSEQKKEIISQTYKTACCRRALLSGFIFAKGTVVSDDTILIKAEKMDTMEFLSRLIKEFYSQSIAPYHPSQGGRCLLAEFKSHAAVKYLSSVRDGGSPYIHKCDMCQSAFLRGIFLASGKICDPARQYLLEFSVGEMTDKLYEYLSSIDMIPNIANKKTGRVLYYRDSAKIEEFTAKASMNSSIFAIMNEQISSDLDNYVQRVSNCTSGNISRTVDAAIKYNSVITKLSEENLLSSLPEELAVTARLRLEYPDLTLAELAKISVPPISKSGLAHRLNKIIELSKKLLGEE